MIEVNSFGDVVQIRMGRDAPEGVSWGAGQEVLYWTAAYLVDGLLIDTGCRHTGEELVSSLDGRNVNLAVNTHYHEDHIGGNTIVRSRFGVEVLASRETIEIMQDYPPLKPYQELIWGTPERCDVGQLPERIRTGRYCFDVLETPGHCRGHVALVEPAMGWCFSGDLLVSTEPRVIRPEENVWETIASMKRILALDSDGLVLFCGAFGKVFQDGLGALRSCVDYLEDLARKVAQLKGRGFSAPKMRDALLGRESSLAELSGGDASSLNLVRALMREEAAA